MALEIDRRDLPNRVCRDALCVQDAFVVTKSDTAGEVLQALVRSIGIVKISDRDLEVYHASPDADRTRPT